MTELTEQDREVLTDWASGFGGYRRAVVPWLFLLVTNIVERHVEHIEAERDELRESLADSMYNVEELLAERDIERERASTAQTLLNKTEAERDEALGEVRVMRHLRGLSGRPAPDHRCPTCEHCEVLRGAEAERGEAYEAIASLREERSRLRSEREKWIARWSEQDENAEQARAEAVSLGRALESEQVENRQARADAVRYRHLRQAVEGVREELLQREGVARRNLREAPNPYHEGQRDAFDVAEDRVADLLNETPSPVQDALGDIARERATHETRGWTSDHDDEHGVAHLIEHAIRYARAGGRRDLVKGGSLVLAAIQWHDRNQTPSPVPDASCQCPPCPGRGDDGHGMEHCAECCFGSGVEADQDCPTHGDPSQARTGEVSLTAAVAALADEYAHRLPGETGNGRPVNSHRVAAELCALLDDPDTALRERDAEKWDEGYVRAPRGHVRHPRQRVPAQPLPRRRPR